MGDSGDETSSEVARRGAEIVARKVFRETLHCSLEKDARDSRLFSHRETCREVTRGAYE